MSSYDYRQLESKYQYNPPQIEKVCRISDILETISQIPFLSERLSLYGGTALNIIHFPQIQRLSVDIDFNYRHQGETKDWGKIRKEIDEATKQILEAQTYKPDDIKIDASYPLSRFTVKYKNHQGVNDTFKIETGYMRRTPILETDAHMDFHHIGTGRTLKVKTPKTEELYANKLVTLLSRATPRDLYDVNIIASTPVDRDTLRKCVILESLMSLQEPITKVDTRKIVKSTPLDESLKSVLRIKQRPDIEKIRENVVQFSETLISNLTKNERECIDHFYTLRQFQPELLELTEINSQINSHPAILWALKN
ncbi:MAG: nucleotidyl transferase AbiEii/AbiGii toxin family protein [Candidatus Bathyarchaeota archaeon]|nr:nucleotidyl transferase AbiEii/AbiGii toxin family protein [Candidatus Bathyarchaeota archaeon]